MKDETLFKRRILVAEDFWKSVKIPKGLKIEDAGRFESSNGRNFFTRRVFINFKDSSAASADTSKMIFTIEFKNNSTVVKAASLGKYTLEVPPKFSSKNSYDKIALTNQILSSLNETEELGKMLDREMEDGNFHSDDYVELAGLINQAIKSIETIKGKI